jgi:hypothetical protein
MPNFGWNENIKVEIKDLFGNLIDTTEFHNQITNVGLNFIADSLRKSTQTNDIKYLAWGSSDLATATTDIILAYETGRKLITTATSSNVGVCYNVCYIAPTEAIGQIDELGWFAGEAATPTSDTGILISRTTYSHTKTALESITITRVDTFTTG